MSDEHLWLVHERVIGRKKQGWNDWHIVKIDVNHYNSKFCIFSEFDIVVDMTDKVILVNEPNVVGLLDEGYIERCKKAKKVEDIDSLETKFLGLDPFENI